MSSLTDVFHPDIDSYRHEAWDIIRQCPQHTFQILTKRPERIKAHLPEFWDEIKNHVWLGTSIGSQDSISRVDFLPDIYNKSIQFLSLEPLHGQIILPFHEYHDAGWRFTNWVIIGGESGNETGLYRYRPCKLEWIENLIDQCREYNIPVFVKQLGTHLSKELGMSDRHGSNIDEFPKHLQIREFPN